MQFEYKEYNKRATDEELISDLKRVIAEQNLSSLSMQEYGNYGSFDPSTISRRFGTWNNALGLAGIELRNRQFTEKELLDNIERVWIAKGHQPTRRDMDDKDISTISSGAYLRKYGKWTNALKTFIDYINNDLTELEGNTTDNFLKLHKTSRDINLRLRFKIMQRDKFKCCLCGASPAKDSLVELHIDHIKPWSKGGETVMENLQTLCSKCNLGKSNLE